MSKEEIFRKLRANLLNYDQQGTEKAAKEAIDKGVSPLEAVNVLSETARELGDKFGRFEIFLPELMMAADALTAGVNVLRAAIPGKEIPKAGVVVIGTVKGDMHSIGKNIVATMLTASGFYVQDIGEDVAASTFADAAEKYGADIVAASALMTTSMPMQKEIVDYFEGTEIREKHRIIVGGAPVTGEYAQEIGADGYGADAVKAVEVAMNLIGKKEGK